MCALQYNPNGIICYKLHFSNTWTDLLYRRLLLGTHEECSPLYEGPCPIKATKFSH